MPLPGGASDKLGNRYELWWTVSQLIHILNAKADSIRIEDPGVDKAEFVVTSGARRELHQAKRSHTSGKWSLSTLGSAKYELLQTIFNELSGNDDQFIFVSGSDAPELRELAHRASSALDLNEFESVFVKAKTQEADFKKLRSYWKNVDTETAYKILQRIEVRAIDEKGLEELVKGTLPALFLSKPDDVGDALRCIAEDSIHKNIGRDELITEMKRRGFALRRITNPGDAPPQIADVTRRYLGPAKRKLIQKSLIPRAATQELLEKIDQSAAGCDCVLTGKAGGGKTGCVIEYVDILQTRRDRAAVLCFRLDSLDTAVSTTNELGISLGLEESPAIVLAAAADAISGEAVLVIDQLDAVSTTSGRSPNFFDVVEGLLVEARGLRERVKFHVVVVCREFDWENDHRLRCLLSKERSIVKAIDFSLEEVEAAVISGGFDKDLFEQRQLELLRLPQNLSLFIETSYDPEYQPKFFSTKELFDHYWVTKRRAVADRAVPLQDQWNDVIQALCDVMTATQQLSVSKEKLNQFPDDYLHQMASEGVLWFDGKRYGFSHESFFDYCFARAFVAKEIPLVEYLVSSEQHLFRRAQVRQVLAYLRDADRMRYCNEIKLLLEDAKVRVHLKDLVIALVVAMPDPDDDEWKVLVPWIKSEIEAFNKSVTNPDKFSSLVWRHFFTSKSLFHLADRKGLISGWLGSNNNNIVNMGVNYVRYHQRYSGDRVAELLEPYVGKGGDWPQRLCHVIQWADIENSRKFFDLFLRLADDGTLDDARGPIAVNSTFWSMLYGLAKARPDWIPEVIAHWLRRRLSLIRENKDSEEKPSWRDLFGNDDAGSEHFHESASKAPDEFVQHVLPVVLEISDDAVYEDESSKPRRDAVWPYHFKSKHESIDDACRTALSEALETLVETKPESIVEILATLQARETYIANFLLLRTYTAGASYFADESVSIICNQPWRFQCGYSDSPYWVAIQFIKAVTPFCSEENRSALETTILDYAPGYEQTPEGIKSRGGACFALLSGIPVELRSQKAQSRYKELKRKFGDTDSAPIGIRTYTVGSPIEKIAAKKMTDEQWLRAIKKYQSHERKHQWEDPEKGGSRELAGLLQVFVREDPERFAHLSLQFPEDVNPIYLMRTLDGLKESSVSSALKFAVCQKAYSESRDACGSAIADLLGTIKEPLPDEAVDILNWLGTEHPDPERELWDEEATAGRPYYGGDILTHGINSTRGRTALAIRDLIFTDPGYVERFSKTLHQLVTDNSTSVRSCAASTLIAVAQYDWPLSFELLLKLIEPHSKKIIHVLRFRQLLRKFGKPLDKYLAEALSRDDQLLVTQDVERFIYYGIQKHFDQLRPLVERMLRAKESSIRETGSRLVCLAAFHHRSAVKLAAEAMRGDESQRLGVAKVASANIGKADCSAWCEEHLLVLFNDKTKSVCSEAGSCFRQLKNEPLEEYEELITSFCDSAAYQEDSFSILHVLKISTRRLPGITGEVCDKFLSRFSAEARDIQTGRAGDVHTVSKLIFRTYHQHQHDEWAPRCLDLIDQMCLAGIQAVTTGFDEYER